MSESRISYGNVKIHTKGSLITISFDCDFGPLAFSFSPEKFSDHLSMIVSQTLDRIYRDDPDMLNAIARNSKLSVNEVRNLLEAHLSKEHRTTPPSALEKFMRGRNLTLEGTLQQVMENLPASIVLMLMQLTAANLVTATDVTKKDGYKTLLIDKEFCQLFYK